MTICSCRWALVCLSFALMLPPASRAAEVAPPAPSPATAEAENPSRVQFIRLSEYLREDTLAKALCAGRGAFVVLSAKKRPCPILGLGPRHSCSEVCKRYELGVVRHSNEHRYVIVEQSAFTLVAGFECCTHTLPRFHCEALARTSRSFCFTASSALLFKKSSTVARDKQSVFP